MKRILLALAVVLLVSEVHGFFGDFWGGRENGRGGWGMPPPFGRPPRGGLHNLFPKCKDFVKEIHDKLRETGCGPGACRNAQDQDDCKFQELMKARMAVKSEPTKECWNQVENFMNGTPTSGNNTSEESTSQ
ncbi:hypothetical protein AVEN_204129-1 [Araneus ventricosus]|uniref:Uncharacterized protein n=1 Tax=Araneus ventricosus TaxID=182803 RepID=A0A4Y2TAE0_ARAVE|nr:hypothetical protein AVEN_204129-1 [Araneus ventricosus]